MLAGGSPSPGRPSPGGSTIHTTISVIRHEFDRYRTIATRALERVEDEAFFREPGPELNSLAVLVKHMGGNLRSRWTDFLTTDGEKPDRNRDGEFVIGPEDDRETLMARWDEGWDLVFAELDRLDDSQLSRTVHVRGEPHGVRAAILRQLAHAVYHVGQIVLLARMYTPEWPSLSIPRDQSERYTRSVRKEAGA